MSNTFEWGCGDCTEVQIVVYIIVNLTHYCSARWANQTVGATTMASLPETSMLKRERTCYHPE